MRFLKLSLAGVATLTLLTAGCRFRAVSDNDAFDGAGGRDNTGGSSSFDSGDDTGAGGDATGTGTDAGAGGTDAGGTDTGGTDPFRDFVCDPPEAERPEAAELGGCDFWEGTDPCGSCLAAQCCLEVSQCAATPSDPCFYGGPDLETEHGEWAYSRGCMMENYPADAADFGEVTDQCIEASASPECAGPSEATWQMVVCAAALCETECFVE